MDDISNNHFLSTWKVKETTFTCSTNQSSLTKTLVCHSILPAGGHFDTARVFRRVKYEAIGLLNPWNRRLKTRDGVVKWRLIINKRKVNFLVSSGKKFHIDFSTNACALFLWISSFLLKGRCTTGRAQSFATKLISKWLPTQALHPLRHQLNLILRKKRKKLCLLCCNF